jgi:ferredoxin
MGMEKTFKKSVIYYFSGTGNSFKVAEDIAHTIHAETVDISTLVGKETISIDSETVGFVFPIYDFKAPEIMQTFVSKINNLDNRFIFAICTYGIASSKAMELFSENIKNVGGKLSLGFVVQMPHNGVSSGIFSEHQHEKMFSHWETKRKEITQTILNHENREMEKNRAGELIKIYFFQGTVFKMIPTLTKMLFKVTRHGWESIAYTTNDLCIGCGICEKVCPMNNIKIENGKPVWSDHCANCFACLQWCPQSAITLGNTDLNIKKYHHPDVSLADILKKRNNTDCKLKLSNSLKIKKQLDT